MSGSVSRRADWVAAALLVLVAVGVAALAPRDLWIIDEGVLLLGAARILDGQVVYRDFFEILPPGGMYVVAAAFWAFGRSMLTARVLSGAVEVLILLAMFCLSRRLGVSRPLAVAAALVQLALATTSLPIASVHWMGTLLILLALWIALGDSRRRAVWLGVVIGGVGLVQHQKGAVMVVIAAAALGLGTLAGGRRDRVRAELTRYALGLLAVGGPAAAATLYAAGVGPIVDSLVRFPLQHYRGDYNRPGWGFGMPAPHHGALIAALPGLPVLVVPTLLRAALTWVGARQHMEQMVVLALFGIGSILSVTYNPDQVHLAVASPVPLILAADSASWALRRISRTAPRAAAAVVWVVSIALALLSAVQLHATQLARRAAAPVSIDTPFGRVDIGSEDEAALLAFLEQRLAAAPRREVFGYPFYVSLPLLVGASNPTRFGILLPGYNSPAQIDEVIATLDARQVPYVLVLSYWIDWQHDPMVAYLQRAYSRVEGLGGRRGLVLFERRPAPATP